MGVLRALEDGSFSYYATSQTLKRGARFKGGWTSAISGRILFEAGPQLSKMWHKVSDLDRDWGQQFAEDFGFTIQPWVTRLGIAQLWLHHRLLLAR